MAAQNLGWIVAERFARLLCNVLVGFLVARHLGAAQFGLLSYALAFVALGLAVAEAGVEGVVKREILRAPERGAAVLAAAWRVRFFGGATCYVLVAAWSFGGEPRADVRALLLVSGLLLFQPALAVADLWLQATLRAGLATRAQLIGLAVGAASRLLLVFTDGPLWAYAAAGVGEAIVTVALLNRFARAAGKPGRELAGGPGLAPQLLAESWPLLFSGLTVMIYMRLDIIMLRHMVGEAQAGAYAAAVRLSELWAFLPGAVAASLLPALLAARAAGTVQYARAMQRFFDLSAGCAYVLAFSTVLLAPWIVRFTYGGHFADAAPVLAVHGWTLMWGALGVGRGQFCINEGLTRFHLVATTAGAAVNIGLNLWLIPRYGAVGAAWATLVAQALAAWGSSFWYQPVRACALWQTRALLIPLRWPRYIGAAGRTA